MTSLAIFSGDLWAGAEVMIFNLLAQLHQNSRLRLVALALNEGTLVERLRGLPIETHVIPEARCAFPQIVLQAIRSFRGQQIHVVHSHRYKENILAFLLSLILRPKLLVSTVHGLPELLEGKRPQLDPLVRINYALLKRQFTRAIAVSHDIKRRLIQEFGFPHEKITVIHNGLRLTDALSSPTGNMENPGRTLHIGTVGRLVAVKDFGLFLSIAARIRQEFRNVRFSILGDGPLREDLVRESLRLGIADCCEILASVSDPMPYYRSLDVYLNTSQHEGIPMSILEAMACGVPVVAPQVGGIPEVLLHGVEGLLVQSRSSDDFAQACVRLLNDQTLRCAIGQHAKRTVANRFSAAVMASRYLDLYTSVPSCASTR